MENIQHKVLSSSSRKDFPKKRKIAPSGKPSKHRKTHNLPTLLSHCTITSNTTLNPSQIHTELSMFFENECTKFNKFFSSLSKDGLYWVNRFCK